MSANNYKDYIALLKSREARPSFERTKAIIESRENESAAFISSGSKVRNLAVGIAALVLLALIGRSIVHDSPKTPLATKNASAATSFSASSPTETHGDNSTSISSLRGVPEGRRSNPFRLSRNKTDCFVTPPGFLAMTNNTNNSAKDISTTEESPSVPLVAYVPPRRIIIECVPQKDIPLTLSQIALPSADEQSTNRFFVTLNGSLSQELNSIAVNNRYSFDGFFGGGYIISPRLSIGLIGGRETFAIKQPYYKTNFTPSQFVHDSVSYPGLIGNIDTNYTPQSTQVYSIGANIRYTFIENSMTPYAEIMGGGSTEGAIAGAAIGASIFRFDQLSFDAGAFIRALIPTAGSAYTKLGASAQLRYDW